MMAVGVKLYAMTDTASSPRLFILAVAMAPCLLIGVGYNNTIRKAEEYEEKDKVYVEGVRNGWSIYFLGAMQKYIIVPGLISRSDIELQIPKAYKKITPDISYFNTNNKQVL